MANDLEDDRLPDIRDVLHPLVQRAFLWGGGMGWGRSGDGEGVGGRVGKKAECENQNG